MKIKPIIIFFIMKSFISINGAKYINDTGVEIAAVIYSSENCNNKQFKIPTGTSFISLLDSEGKKCHGAVQLTGTLMKKGVPYGYGLSAIDYADNDAIFNLYLENDELKVSATSLPK